MTTDSGKNGGGRTGRGRRGKTFLSPSAKCEIYLQLMRGETTIAQAATAAGVDRSTILRIRTVGKEAALAALAASKRGPGSPPGTWSWRPRTPRLPGCRRPVKSWR